MAIYKYLCKTFSAVTLITVLSGLLISNDSMAAVPIVQPGAPGEASLPRIPVSSPRRSRRRRTVPDCAPPRRPGHTTRTRA